MDYTLTDDSNVTDKWSFPSFTLQPNRQFVVFACIDEDPSTGNDLYTDFNLHSAGEYVRLYDPDGVNWESNGKHLICLPSPACCVTTRTSWRSAL